MQNVKNIVGIFHMLNDKRNKEYENWSFGECAKGAWRRG